MPGSPPDLTGSKSSKSSSFHSSYQSDEGSILENINHFEEIGLDDDDDRSERDMSDFTIVKTSPTPYAVSFSTADLRSSSKQRNRLATPSTHGNLNPRPQRELTSSKTRPPYPSLRGPVRSVTTPTDGLGLLPTYSNNTATAKRGFTSPSLSSLPLNNRKRSPSPAYAKHLTTAPRPRRGSWQSNRERKTALELEKECDEDDGDDLPDEVILENIPMSPRPPNERTSAPPSASTSPSRQPKEKIRSLGNGTSPHPVETGCLKSPRSTMIAGSNMNHGPVPTPAAKGRAKSWTSAVSALSEEARALTAALEDYAEEEESKMADPNQRRSFNVTVRPPATKPRAKSAFPDLPPLRRSDIMIDPLPISKEKEAVLSRTRPSWLPPKNPEEERRHLKEYQKMMIQAEEAERKREARRNTQSACRDDTASSLLRIWEEHVMPNWENVTRQKRTRELWWRGIAPRSRGAVWNRAIGNELELTEASYKAALRRAQEMERRIKRTEKLNEDEQKKKAWFDRIDQDVLETYKELRIFQPSGPLHSSLVDVLRAYAMYRSDVGYVHGTSTIAAILLLNLPTTAASFINLANILNRPLPLSFHTGDSGAISKVYRLVLSILAQKSPHLYSHLVNVSSDPHTYLHDLFRSLFTSSLSLDNATRLWDVMAFEGDAICVRAAVAFLVKIEGTLFGCGSEAEFRDAVNKGLDSGLGEEDWMSAIREAGKS